VVRISQEAEIATDTHLAFLLLAHAAAGCTEIC
jgi:hypothetical protein